MKRYKRQILKWFLYGLFLFLLFILQSTPDFLAVFEIKPLVLFSIGCAVGLFEEELPSAVFAAMCGLLTDYSAARTFGFYGFIFTILIVMVSLLTRYLIKPNFPNYFWINSLGLVLLIHLDFFVSFCLWGYGEVSGYYLRYTLPTLVYSVAVSPLFFFPVRKIALRLNKPREDQPA